MLQKKKVVVNNESFYFIISITDLVYNTYEYVIKLKAKALNNTTIKIKQLLYDGVSTAKERKREKAQTETSTINSQLYKLSCVNETLVKSD